MILPMMGFLFTLGGGGLLAAVVLAIVPAWRRWVPFALVPVLAAVGAFVSCWGLAVGLERLFASGQVGGIGFFGGYLCGGLLGAALGAWSAYRLIRRRVPNNALQRTGIGGGAFSDRRA